MWYVLDATVVSSLCTPRDKSRHQELARWFVAFVRRAGERLIVAIPEIVDYEVRRGLLHLAVKEGRDALNAVTDLEDLIGTCQYLPLNTPVMRSASRLWAEARARGQPTAADDRLDADSILAAQAQAVGATIVTDNIRHLAQFGPAKRWKDIDLGTL